MENNKTPSIRFKGFIDPWEQRKWIDTVDISTEMVDPTSGEFDDMPHIAPGNIESFTGRILDNVKSVKEEQLISGKFRFRPGDVVYGKINPQLGKYFYASVDGLTSADAYVFNGKNGISQKFLFSLLQTADFFKYSVSVSKRSGMPKINRDELNAYSFLAPNAEEQNKIGDFLLELDHLITLHQRKYDKLQNIKKSMLEKMFPKNGSNVPEIRFSGFTDPWEQRKLGDVAQYRNGKAHENCIDENGKYVVVNSKFVSTDGEVKKFSNMQNEALFENEIAFVLSDVPNGRAIARTYLIEKSDKYTLNQRIAGITPLNETYPYFLYILMNRHPYFLAFDDGAKQTNLSVSDVMGFETYYPKYSEQQKIGAYFRNLDHLITLHQRELEKLQNIKKSMLEKMFV